MRLKAIAVAASLIVASPLLSSGADLTLKGDYLLDGIKRDTVFTSGFEDSDAWFENQLHLDLLLQEGAVTAGVELEVVDTNESFPLEGHQIIRVNPSNDIINNYWVAWKPTDELTVKTGGWPVDWGRRIALYAQGGYNLSAVYSFDVVDLGLLIGKVEEGDYWDGFAYTEDADRDQLFLTASFKEVGPFTRLDALYLFDQAQATSAFVTDFTASLFGLDFALPLGPVDLAGELGFFMGDDLGGYDGNYLLLEAGLARLLPFDLTLAMYRGSEDLYGGYGEDFAPLEVVFNSVGYQGNMQALWLKGKHPWGEKLTLGWALLPYMAAVETDADVNGDGYLDTWHSGGNLGTEVDVSLSYQIAGNLTYEAAVGYLSVSDAARNDLHSYIGPGGFTYFEYGPFYGVESVLNLWNRLTFTF